MGVPVETGVVVKYVRLSVCFLNFKFASMASTRRHATATPSTWPSESLRVSTLSFDAGEETERHGNGHGRP